MLDRRRFVKSLLVSALVACSFGVVSLSPAGTAPAGRHHTGAIAGLVVDSRDHHVAGAEVVLFDAHGHRVAHTTSSRDGHFGFRHVSPGQYVVTATKVHVGTASAHADVRSGHVSRVRLVLH